MKGGDEKIVVIRFIVHFEEKVTMRFSVLKKNFKGEVKLR